MAFEERPGSGTLFRNEDAEANPKAPAYKGTLCLLTGEVIRIAGWVKEGKKGRFLSISIDKPRADFQEIPKTRYSFPSVDDNDPNSIPF